MRKPKRMLVIPIEKENAKKSILDILQKAGVPVQKIETELIGDEVVVWVTSPQEKKAKEILKEKDIKSFTSDVVIVRLPDKPGELAKIARILSSSGIVVKDAHIILKSKKNVLYGLTTNKPRLTAKIIEKVETFLKENKE